MRKCDWGRTKTHTGETYENMRQTQRVAVFNQAEGLSEDDHLETQLRNLKLSGELSPIDWPFRAAESVVCNDDIHDSLNEAWGEVQTRYWAGLG